MPQEMTTSQSPSTAEGRSSHKTPPLSLSRFEGDALKGFREEFTTSDLQEVERLAQRMIAKQFPTLRLEKDELVQETLKNFINLGLKNYSPEKGELVGYLYTTMRNTAIKLLEQRLKVNRAEPVETVTEKLPLAFSTFGDSHKEIQPIPIQLEEREWAHQQESLLHMALPNRQTSELTEDHVLPEEVHGFIWTRFTMKTLGESEKMLIAQVTQLSTSEKSPLEHLEEAIEFGLIHLSLPARQLLTDFSVNKLTYEELAQSYGEYSKSPGTMVKMRMFRAREKVLVKATEYLSRLLNTMNKPTYAHADQ